MFRGRFEHTIDAKGRLSIPSKFRDILRDNYDERLVVTTYDGCLLAYPYAEWRKLEEKVNSLPQFSIDTRRFYRSFYSSANDCFIDRLGRIIIPQPLRDYAGLSKDVTLIGAHLQLEIWDRERWNVEEAKSTSEDIGIMLDRMGI